MKKFQVCVGGLHCACLDMCELRDTSPAHLYQRARSGPPSRVAASPCTRLVPCSDYYRGSDLIGLASRRCSHVYAHETLSTVRCPSVPCQAHCLLLAVECVQLVASSLAHFHVRIIYVALQRRRFRTATTDVGFTVRNLDSTVPVSPYVQDLRNGGIHSFCELPLYQHAPVPFGFRRQVSCYPGGHLPSTSPALRRNFIRADMAHDPDPHICQCSHGDRMTFAFSALALVILHGPRLALRGLPGKLVQRIAQRFDAAQTSMRLGVHPALKQHGRGSSQSLQEAFILIALAIITDF